MIHVHGFFPYIYVPAPAGITEEELPNFIEALEKESQGKSIDVCIVERKNIYGYGGEANQKYIKITSPNGNHSNAVRRVLENGMAWGRHPSKPHATFESNLPFVMRFMIDCQISGMNWIELPAGSYKLRRDYEKTGTCQIEADVMFDKLISHHPEGEWSHIGPIRVLSFDIECAGRKGAFPEASQDPVIQIASTLTVQGESIPRVRHVLTLGSCSNIVGAEVYSFEDEGKMLMAWLEFVQMTDPDVIIGYNILNFDFPYLLDRAEALRLDAFPFLGRIAGSHTKAKDSIFSSKAYGTRESKSLNIEGRIIFDILQVMQRDYKLRSYSLNAVSAHFLGEQKEDVQHSIITDLFNGNDETRRRLAVYCLKDAYLPQRLMDKLMLLINYTEMARVTGIPFNFILARGQQVKVVSQLYRRAAEEGYVIPAMKGEASDEQYEGATVIEPHKGYYDIPIATLDFASLYPSIMMAHNLCYTTLLDPSQISQYELSPDSYTRTPSGDYFVKPNVRRGILPLILEDLITARKRAKNDLKKETDPAKRAVLDGRQLALKISANSVYGFTGATVGKLPCIQISQSVTSFGRQMIEQTQKLVEERYCKANGYTYDAKVIYGDTDSVMIRFGPTELAEVMNLGKDAAQYVTGTFIKPISLEFEKCYYPYLLISKKRYAGLYWTNPEKYDKMDSKGIETVRRDNCRLVQTVIDTCLRKILIERDVEGAKDYAKQVISDLLQNKVDLSQLVITKALSKTGEEYAGKQAHVELAERMKKRDAGSAPSLGDRVAYVIVKSGKGAAAYEKSEDPIYVLEHNLPIDTKYYLENQLSKPLLRIFEPILKNPQELLTGDHTRVVHVSTSTLGAMSKFAVKLDSCYGCKAGLKKEDIEITGGLVCKHCKPRLPDYYMRQLETTTDLEERFSRLWTQCQRCQGSLHQDILCTSRDCPIFYMRKKAQKDVDEATKTLEKFTSVNW